MIAPEISVIQRKLKLKAQAARLIREERTELQQLLNLIKIRDHLTSKIGKEFDPNLSAQIDAVQFLIDSLCGRPLALNGRSPDLRPACHSLSGRDDYIEQSS